ncbi:MAG: Lrp/AsnC family leucine-responsive transcriptional regulator [Porticoccus sp.]|jgi:Lrp/AsnC family leucine-responsive transcriptional regulator
MDKKNNASHIDHYSLKIIDILKRNGRLPITELAKEVGISKTPCQSRLKRLQDENYILGFKAIINNVKLNQEHIAFVEVKMAGTREVELVAFNKAVHDIPQIEECHLIASSFDYLLKVRTADIGEYRKVLGESISSLPHVAYTSTFISMQPIKDSNNSEI